MKLKRLNKLITRITLTSIKVIFKKTWKIVNELSSKNVCKTNRITRLKMAGQEISTPGEIAETFNSYFSNIGIKLASEIPPSEHEPSFYLKLTDKSFHPKLRRFILFTNC